MKWVVRILCLAGVSGILGGITSVQRWSFSTGVTHYASSFERAAVFAIGLLCAIAAYACTKRKKFGWWLVSGIVGALIVFTAWSIARVILTDPLLGAWWLVQIGLMILYLRWWSRQAALFSKNEKEG